MRNTPSKTSQQKGKGELIAHYEAVEQLKEVVSPNMVTRVTMLPEGIVREVQVAYGEVSRQIPKPGSLGKKFLNKYGFAMFG